MLTDVVMQKDFIIPNTLHNLHVFKSFSAFVVTWHHRQWDMHSLRWRKPNRQKSSGHLGSVLNFGGVLIVLKT